MKNPHTPRHQRLKSGIWWPVLSCGEGHLIIRTTKIRTSCCQFPKSNNVTMPMIWKHIDLCGNTWKVHICVSDFAGQGKFLFLRKIELPCHPIAHLQLLQLKSALWGTVKVIVYRPARAELLEKSNWCGEHSRQEGELDIFGWAGSCRVSWYVWWW